MNQNKKSPPAPTEALPAPKPGGASQPFSAYKMPDGVIIDFQSAEFNRIDDLSDNSMDYRSFESLEGVTTADECHRAARRHHEEAQDFSPYHSSPPDDAKDLIGGAPFAGDTVFTIVSKGRTLIIDTDEERGLNCIEILTSKKMTCTLLIKKGAAGTSGLPRPNKHIVFVDDVLVTGALGRFSAMVTMEGVWQDLARLLHDQPELFDLVLDLQNVPSFAGDCLPVGYYAPGPNPEGFDAALIELTRMRGKFIKPQFVLFDEARCFHGRSRTLDCHRCQDICPAGAIQSAGRKISINHYFCQGCGGCSLACPANAIRPVGTSPSDLVEKLIALLREDSPAADKPKVVAISDSYPAVPKPLPGNDPGGCPGELHFKVEQISSAGLEILLTALVYGADEVHVLCGPEEPSCIRDAVRWQVEMARAMLRNIHLSEDKCRFVIGQEERAASTTSNFSQAGQDSRAFISSPEPVALPNRFEWTAKEYDKRVLIRLMAQSLYDRSGLIDPQLVMPVSFPFGAIVVDPTRCTSCMACVGVCPSGALSAGGDKPCLFFREISCNQCGLCAEMCPEQAIKLVPRLLCDPAAVEKTTVVFEGESLRCIECGIPFGSRAMVRRLEQKLAGHWMYTDEHQMRRLHMCSECRTLDVVSFLEAKR